MPSRFFRQSIVYYIIIDYNEHNVSRLLGGSSMMRILAIGNSFSQDATTFLEPIARSAGLDWLVRNAFIGGCSLERHWENVRNGEVVYEYQENGEALKMVSIDQALLAEPWDWITLQQVSHHAGLPETYEPYLSELIRYIQKMVPGASIAFHQTWAYEFDSDHGGFALYQRDRKLMFREIKRTVDAMAKRHRLPVIPVGSTIERLRTFPEFDPQRGGSRLTRDGFHLSYDYGRYAAGLVWFSFFGKTPLSMVSFTPSCCDGHLCEMVRNSLLE